MTDIHQSATTLNPLTGEVKNFDRLITMQSSAGKTYVLAFTCSRCYITMHNPPKYCCRSHPPIATALRNGSGLPQQHKVLTHPPNSPQLSIRGMPWNKSDPQGPHPRTHRTQRRIRCRTPQETPRGPTSIN